VGRAESTNPPPTGIAIFTVPAGSTTVAWPGAWWTIEGEPTALARWPHARIDRLHGPVAEQVRKGRPGRRVTVRGWWRMSPRGPPPRYRPIAGGGEGDRDAAL